MEDMNRKCVPTDGSMWLQKALSLYEDFSKGSSEASDTKPFTASKGLHGFRNRFGLKNIKRHIGGERYADICNEEVKKQIECHEEVLMNEELEELVDLSTEEVEETEAEPAMWTLPKFAEVVSNCADTEG